MNDIIEIIIHHSVSSRDQTLDASVSSFNRTHKRRLHTKPNSLGYHIAYHYVIAGDGSYKQTRAHNEVGYHSSNRTVNERSLGICLTGNFDHEKPSKAQEQTLKDLIKKLKIQYDIVKINGHRQYSNKTCPGMNISDEFIDYLLTMKDMEFKHDYIAIMEKEVPKNKRVFNSYEGDEAQIKALIAIAIYRANK